MPVYVAENMLQTKFASFLSALVEDVTILRITQPYSLPQNVAEAVSLVDDILRFPAGKSKQLPVPDVTSTSGSTTSPEFNSCGSSCTDTITPAVLEETYSYTRLNTFTPGEYLA